MTAVPIPANWFPLFQAQYVNVRFGILLSPIYFVRLPVNVTVSGHLSCQF